MAEEEVLSPTDVIAVVVGVAAAGALTYRLLTGEALVATSRAVLGGVLMLATGAVLNSIHGGERPAMAVAIVSLAVGGVLKVATAVGPEALGAVGDLVLLVALAAFVYDRVTVERVEAEAE